MERTVAHYNLLEKIGEGGLGELYRARDTKAGRTVALKLLPPLPDQAASEARLNDARAAATLSHPNIAQLWDVGEDEGVSYISYEFVGGAPLSHEMAGGRIHPRRAVELATQVADALAEAHARGLIHGDIRPDTIAVTQKGSAKLLDFGMSRWTRGGAVRARAATAPATLPPDALSTVSYLSPEQALGGLVDIRTDVFSLGLILYEMLTGLHPFRRPTADATVVAIISTVPPPPSAATPEIPTDLDAIVLRALSKDIEGRQQSAASLSAELRSVGAVLDVRSGDTAPRELMPLPEDPSPSGPGFWIGLFVITMVVAAVVWWWVLAP
jgi:serine/threonine protein kinase